MDEKRIVEVLERLVTSQGKIANAICGLSILDKLEKDVGMNERRNDVGVKLGFFVLTAVIAGMLSIFFWGTYNRADEAVCASAENKIDIAVLKEAVLNIDKKLNIITSYVVVDKK